MKGNRNIQQGETLPDVEVVTHERRTEIRYDFSEVTDDEGRTSYNYKYIKVYDLKELQMNDALSQRQIKRITDKANIDNPVAFKGRRWEELVCHMEDQTTKDYLMNADRYSDKILPMPAEGEWCEKGIIYKLNGEYWGCKQPHSRMHFHPSDTPALFNKIPVGITSTDYPEWQQPTGAHDAYNTGDFVSKNGVNYKSNIDANTYDPEVYNDETYPNTPSWQYWDKEPFA